MSDEFARVDRQIGLAPHADRQLANRPFVEQLDVVDRHGLCMALRGRRRYDADPDIAFDETANRVEAAQLYAQSKTPTNPFSLFRQKALQCACPVETDKIEIEHFGEGDPFYCR